MAKQTFTTGQVLTSSQMTALQLNDYNQTVNAKVASYTLVASDAGTRITMSNASSTTITVNSSLFAAGDTLFITNIGAGTATITAGTATVSTGSSLALAQYDSGSLYFTSTGVAIWQKYDTGAGGGGGGMTLLSTTTLSGTSTVISVASGYINLFIVISGVTASANYELAYRINNIGGSGYYGQGQRSSNAATSLDPADTFYVFAPGSTSALAASANNVYTTLIQNYDSNTKYKTMTSNAGITDNGSALYQINSQYVLFDTTAMTSFKVMTTAGSATFSAGTVLIYGVK